MLRSELLEIARQTSEEVGLDLKDRERLLEVLGDPATTAVAVGMCYNECGHVCPMVEAGFLVLDETGDEYRAMDACGRAWKWAMAFDRLVVHRWGSLRSAIYIQD